jgi:peptidoglycan hydrolase-like protein with peptidoglycan-binding domain
MKSIRLATAAAFLFAFVTFAPAQSQKHPTGTEVTQKHADGSTEVQPDFKQAPLSENDVIEAQKKLNDNGYNAGTPDGKMGPNTRAAIRKYQQDNNIAVSGKLDESTRTHLNVGAGKTMASAPSAIGRGAKAAGHNFKEGHPLAAAKALGKGVGHAGKSVAEGTKSGVMGSKDKIAGNKAKSENGNQPPR